MIGRRKERRKGELMHPQEVVGTSVLGGERTNLLLSPIFALPLLESASLRKDIMSVL